MIDDAVIRAELETPPRCDAARVRDILAKARALGGLAFDETLDLLRVEEPQQLDAIFETARFVKNEIYGNRVVLFAPLYVSNLCRNDCAYCAFRTSNPDVARKALSLDEIRSEVEVLLSQGHKRLLLVSGEAFPEQQGLRYITDALDAIYDVRTEHGNIRRVNVNIAPLSVEEFRELKSHRIGTYQIFQETYHEPTYRAMHPRGPKSDYHDRIATVGRAFEAGIDDIGVGLLFGLHDWRYEVVALLSHIRGLEERYGIGPHTISVPRIEPADGSPVSSNPPAPVSDADFRKIIAVLRMAVPYTGMILSTRESATMRRDALELGISQISAGSRTDPGGYGSGPAATGQFSLGDTRPLAEVVRDLMEHDHLPSFCTGCYRLGRVGKDFMDLAKPGAIKRHCLPNAVFTFAEYLYDFADPAFRQDGFRAIGSMMRDDAIPEGIKLRIRSRLARIHSGARDVFV